MWQNSHSSLIGKISSRLTVRIEPIKQCDGFSNLHLFVIF